MANILLISLRPDIPAFGFYDLLWPDNFHDMTNICCAEMWTAYSGMLQIWDDVTRFIKTAVYQLKRYQLKGQRVNTVVLNRGRLRSARINCVFK